MTTAALSVRTHFSIKESILDPSKIGQLAKDNGYDAVAIVDNMNINGLVDLTKSCKKAGVKPIIGCRLAVYDDPSLKQTKAEAKISTAPNAFWMPKVYAKNEAGMKAIIQLLARANEEDYFYYTPRTGLDELIELVSTGDVILLSGDAHALFSHKRGDSIADAIIAACSGLNFYIEITPIATPLYDRINKLAYQYAVLTDTPMIATTPFLYETDADADSLDVMNSVISQKLMSSPFVSRPYVRTQSFKPIDGLKLSLDELAKRINIFVLNAKSMLDNIEVVADQCTYEWNELPVSLPVMAPNEMNALVALVKKGWAERLTKPVMGYQPTTADLPIYKERLQYELGILKKMGFERYFLLVSDIVQWAKENDVPVGAGRGSAAGSLVSYLLKITDVDPIRFNLIFERFINPERIDLPDIDLDFASSKRGEVIEYIKNKYGEEYVAGISNYVKLGSASGIRDIGKTFGLQPFDMTCTKLMPKEHGEMLDIDVAADMVPEIEKFKNAHPEVWGHAQKLVGSLRNYGKHAAGVIVAGEPIRNRAVLERRSGELVCNWDRNSVEKWGLIKIDVLGLSTLDVIDIAVKSIKDRLSIDIDVLDIPLDDEKTLQAFSEGKTVGIFQLESGGMRSVIKRMGERETLTFNDMCAITALFRPGPLDAGLCEQYVAIKRGERDIDYPHPSTQPALESTFGVMVYQEQIQRIARDLAGFTMAEADGIRKAIGKKDMDKMKEFKDKFLDGAETNSGVSRRHAEGIWEQIEGFAAYSFNLSHAVSYSVISYTAMWLKTHYPLDFFAASMSILADDKMPALVIDANAHGIEIYPPDINISTDKFEISSDHVGNPVLIIPFNRIKGISTNTAKAIVDARMMTPWREFRTIIEFLDNIAKRQCNSRAMDALDKVGAFAHINPGTLPPRHPDRLKDQIELLPGLSSTHVSVTRLMPRTDEIMNEIKGLYSGLRDCADCSLAGGAHPLPVFGRRAEFMIVTDCPTNSEDKEGKMLSGEGANFVKYAIQQAGLKTANGYFTTLVKSLKNGKVLSNEQINNCSKYLDHEIRILKPAVIVLLGNSAIKRFLPGEKKPNENIGKVIYSKELDANLVIGMNPSVVFFSPEKQNTLNEIFEIVANLINN